MKKVFIDGSAGTTGLRIYERLGERKDIELIKLTEELRKDTQARKEAINKADIAFLCLPDPAAVEAVSLCENPDTVIIDTSTAHRCADGWTYGFPELTGLRNKIVSAKRIANPGCHASGFVSLAAPLTEAGILPRDAALSCFSLTGYSGGGKKMIADYEDMDNYSSLIAPRVYGLTQVHKHMPEMAKYGGLSVLPVFSPIVSSYYAGMIVVIPLFAKDVNGSIEDIKEAYAEYYRCGMVKYVPDADENGFLTAAALAGRDDMQISVFGNEERITLVSRFDNLGKGASGSAVQNMNIVMGVPEDTGLVIG